MAETIGLLLAAGAGRRMGRPKALLEGRDGVPWVVSTARTLAAGGCVETVVVVGAAAETVRGLLAGEPVTIIEAADWEAGMGASLRAGLDAIGAGLDATGIGPEAILVQLVDLPDVGPAVIRRLLAHSAPDALARADYGHGPGHPVLFGRDHWAPIAAECAGDRGARAYLARHPVLEVDCSDLATGADIDDSEHYVSMLSK
ncbi:nucleotidyltransferase family protein [Parafrigoribacterium mesophilum]|uniref:nucleotidyltransferase family protein n=1 Tax=Parafrigoribacterium mesophilum TaxID=433646 RepID=UPI0031FC5C31